MSGQQAKIFRFEKFAGDISSLLPSNGISHIRISRDTLWLGTSKGLSRTLDGGISWENFRLVKEFANDGIFAVAIKGKPIWSSTGFNKPIDNGTVQTGSGLTYSLDGGVSWTHRDQPLDAAGDSIIQYGINRMRILPVTVPEQNVIFDISIFAQNVWIASWAGGLRISSDNGNTWHRIVLPPDDFNKISPTDTLNFKIDPRLNNNFLGFSVLTLNDSVIWVGTAGGVNKSTDGGLSWTKFNYQNQDSAILANWVIRIREQNYKGKSRIWTTNWKTIFPTERFGISMTENGGKTWRNFLHDIKAYDFAFQDSIVYVATDEGVFRTDDDGKTWIRTSTIIDATSLQRFTKSTIFSVGVMGTTVWAGGDDGLAKTQDDPAHLFGQRWQIFRSYQAVGTTKIAYAYPNPFSPNDEIVRFHYSTGGKDATVTVELFDFGMNLVRTIIRNAPRIGSTEHDEIWNGRDDRDRRVANGVYFFKIQVDQDAPRWGKVVVLQ